MGFSICRRYVPPASIENVRVLIVEDEPYMAEAIRDGLRLEAIAADIAGDGNVALELLSTDSYDIAVLDRDIPGPSGDEIAQRIVASGSGMPILMLTAADRLHDKTSGFELGADDYLTKPFSRAELLVRLSALRRRQIAVSPPVPSYADNRVLVDFAQQVVRLDGEPVVLTPTEYRLFASLVQHAGQVLSAEQLLELAWDDPSRLAPEKVKYTMLRLRRKLGWDHPESPIETVRGFGYRYRRLSA